MMKCPKCGHTEQQVKAGKNPSGSQRYLCKVCQKVYTPKPRPIGYPEWVKKKAVRLYQEGWSLRAISRELDVWPQSVANWVNDAEMTRPLPETAVSTKMEK